MVDRELFERYEAALGANADLFSRAVQALADKVDGLASDDARARLSGEFPALVRAYGTVAAEAAREFYEEQRRASGVADAHGEYGAVAYLPDELDAESARQVNAAVAGIAQAAGGAVYGFLEGRGIRSVMGCADSTLDRNASRDPARPKWALVPHLGACDWCLMLGSRGFAYQSERTVGASRHNRCKCTPVVDFDTKNPKLDGYDPEKLYERYKAAEEGGETSFRQRRPVRKGRYEKRGSGAVSAQASHAQAAKLVEYLEKAESAEDYMRRALKVDEQWRKSKHEGGAFKTLRAKHVELARRWGVDPFERPEIGDVATVVTKLRTTEPLRRNIPNISISLEEAASLAEFEGPTQWQPRMTILEKPKGLQQAANYDLMSKKEKKRLSENEVSSHKLFEEYGFKPVVLPEDRSASANIDVEMTVNGKTSYWELKDPEKGDRAQKKLTTEGVSKWQRMREGVPQAAISMESLETPRIAIDNRFNEDQTDSDAIRRLVNDMRFYKDKGFDEAILVMKSGAVLHFER